jgi:hypothetical protein
MALTLNACGGGGGGDDDDDNNDDDNSANRAPTAEDISVQNDLTSPYVNIKLIGTDPDNDTLSFVLDASTEGPGYEQAFIDPDSGTLYATLKSDGTDAVILPYKASDGSLYSEVAEVTITIGETENQERGANDIPPEDYGRLELAFFDGERFGSPVGDSTTLPESIDLSGNFPTPGSQGRQGSCVGWATAYALKSYHEKIEEQWSFSEQSTFSPAWIYNQINDGKDEGSRIDNALQLMIDQGAATWQAMPYTDQDYLTQPSEEVVAQAANYKAESMRSVTSAQQMKAALANRSPVVVGIRIFDAFNHLQGSNSVYNTTEGELQGGHAVTLVGYDDNQFGGAFKVINSWGTSWGDNGFFWLPYNKLHDLLKVGFVLTDAKNTGNPDDDVDPVDPPTDENLPNLQVGTWNLNYDTQAGGEGNWTWEVINAGVAQAPAGADVNLVLSVDEHIDSADWVIVYEEIPEALAPGESIGRDESNPRRFNLPQNLPAGSYYIAVWVDDLQDIAESNEQDNQSFGEKQLEIQAASLPDIAIDYWWASWDNQGNGTLEYTVHNVGDAPTTQTDWNIDLILSRDEVPSDGSTYYLFSEHANMLVDPGNGFYRDELNPASFNLFHDVQNNPIPSGTYYISLRVDGQNTEQESNEINNFSIGNNQVTLGGNNNSQSLVDNDQDSSIKKIAQDKTSQMQATAYDGAGEIIQHTFNGRRIPDSRVIMQKVMITDEADGGRRMTFVDDGKQLKEKKAGKISGTKKYNKVINSADQAVFPKTRKLKMPEAQE